MRTLCMPNLQDMNVICANIFRFAKRVYKITLKLFTKNTGLISVTYVIWLLRIKETKLNMWPNIPTQLLPFWLKLHHLLEFFVRWSQSTRWKTGKSHLCAGYWIKFVWNFCHKVKMHMTPLVVKTVQYLKHVFYLIF